MESLNIIRLGSKSTVVKSRTRRELLQFTAPGLLPPASGCTFENDSTEVRIAEISIGNRGPTPYSIHVLLLEDGEPVYWRSKEVEEFSDEDDRFGGGELTGVPSDSGTYVLYAWRGDRPRSEREERDLGTNDSSCAAVLILVGSESENGRGEISIRVSENCSTEDAVEWNE